MLQDKLLNLAKKLQDTTLYEILQWFCDVGLMLVPHPKFGYSLQPIIDETGCNGWRKSEWEQERKALIPYQEQLISLLRSL